MATTVIALRNEPSTDLVVEEGHLDGHRVWAVSLAMPLALSELLAVVMRLPNGSLIDVEMDGSRVYVLWRLRTDGV